MHWKQNEIEYFSLILDDKTDLKFSFDETFQNVFVFEASLKIQNLSHVF